jgi:hypothetical protein
MTSSERTLHTASDNDRGALLRALKIVTCARVQLSQIVGTVVDQRVALESGPEIFDRIELGGVGRE